jgi:ADP-ribosylglycohydrolase
MTKTTFSEAEEVDMIGAIAGDMIGSIYEASPIKRKDFSPRVAFFTDDTVLTIAVAEAILQGLDYGEPIKRLAEKYYHLSYGGAFRKWVRSWDSAPYNSFGNGSAMRVSPVGFAFDPVEKVLKEAKRSAEVTHNHPEGVKGAQSTALAVYLARTGVDKEDIRCEISSRFGYDLDRTVDDIRPSYRFDVSCQGSVPESIIAFLDSDSYEDAVKNAISLGGDADTMACIAGGIAQAYYKKMPEQIAAQAREKLPPDLRRTLDEFNETYGCPF